MIENHVALIVEDDEDDLFFFQKAFSEIEFLSRETKKNEND